MVETKGKSAKPDMDLLLDISGDEIKRSRFSPGNLYWERKRGGALKIASPGDVLDFDRLKKFTMDFTRPLKAEKIVDDDLIKEMSVHFHTLQEANNESERIGPRREILSLFSSVFWEAERSGSLLDLIYVGEIVFYRFEADLTKRLQETSVVLYRRSALTGSLAVILALAMGYMDHKLLRDIYHLCFLFDYAFGRENYTFNLGRASEAERLSGGKGILYFDFTEEATTDTEAEEFMNHPDLGYEKAIKDCSKYFYNPEILRLISRHHERVNGEGFPSGVNEHEISDLETIIIFLSNLISYEDQTYEIGNGKGFLKDIVEAAEGKNIGKVFGVRLRNMLKEIFENIKEEEEQRKEQEIIEDELHRDDEDERKSA